MKDEAHLVISHIDHMSHVIKPSLFITMTLTSIGKIRGPASKTELSLVDKIELARAYQDITGKIKEAFWALCLLWTFVALAEVEILLIKLFMFSHRCQLFQS